VGAIVVKIITWKWKGKTTKNKPEYTAKHVTVLYNMLLRNVKIPFEFICITDDPSGLPEEINTYPLWKDMKNMSGCYRRLKAFSPEMEEVLGPKFFSFDLDCVILRDITDIIETKGNFAIWEDTKKRNTPYCGSLWMYRTGAIPKIWNKFNPNKSPQAAKAAGYRVGTDQAYLSHLFYPSAKTWTVKDGIYNFKTRIENRRRLDKPSEEPGQLPDNARVIFFNGGGIDPSFVELQKRYPWIRKHWR
jgi:hypothetical protein